MQDFDLDKIQPFILIFLGLAILLLSIFKKSPKFKLKRSGQKVEGVVIKKDRASNSNESTIVKDKITVRFVTNNKEWITGEIEQGFTIFFTGQYKEGEAVDIYYDAGNPSEFFVDSKQSEKLARILFGIGGIFFCCTGLFQMFIGK